MMIDIQEEVETNTKVRDSLSREIQVLQTTIDFAQSQRVRVESLLAKIDAKIKNSKAERSQLVSQKSQSAEGSLLTIIILVRKTGKQDEGVAY